MKKIFSVMLALVLMLCAGAVAQEAANSAAGTWYMTGIVIDGVESKPAAVGVEMTMTLNEDGSALLMMAGGTPEETTWSQDGDMVTIISGGDEMPFVLAEGQLILEEQNSAMIFSDEFIPAEPLTDVAIEDFNGAWLGLTIESNGMKAQLDLVGLGVYYEIRNGAIHAEFATQEGNVETDLTPEFVGGALVISSTDAEGNVGSVVIQLMDDGTLRHTETLGENVAVYTFMKTAVL